MSILKEISGVSFNSTNLEIKGKGGRPYPNRSEVLIVKCILKQ